MKKFTTAISGIFKALKSETSLKIHFIAALIVVICGLFFKISTTEWCLIIFAIGLVIAAEIFNTAIEWLCDFVEPDHQKKIGLIKDASAGAVLILSLTAIVIGCIIFIPKLFSICSH